MLNPEAEKNPFKINVLQSQATARKKILRYFFLIIYVYNRAWHAARQGCSVDGDGASLLWLQQHTRDDGGGNIVRFEVFQGADGIQGLLQGKCMIDNVAPLQVAPPIAFHIEIFRNIALWFHSALPGDWAASDFAV